jgi:hypothetical protein
MFLSHLAADVSTGSIDLGVFAQYGVLGVFAAILLWFARRMLQREIDRADRLEAEKKELSDLIIERVIPLLTTATTVINEFQRAQREAELRRVSAAGSATRGEGA